MSVRIASSSRANSSTSSSVRCAYCLMSVIAMSLLDVEGAVAGGRGDARVYPVALSVLIAGPEITSVPCLNRQHARLADTHPATERHLDADLLAGLQKRSRAVYFDALVGD